MFFSLSAEEFIPCLMNLGPFLAINLPEVLPTARPNGILSTIEPTVLAMSAIFGTVMIKKCHILCHTRSDQAYISSVIFAPDAKISLDMA